MLVEVTMHCTWSWPSLIISGLLHRTVIAEPAIDITFCNFCKNQQGLNFNLE